MNQLQFLLSFQGINREFPGGHVLKDISFSVVKNKINGLLGPNGAGKSTTLRIMAGILRPSSGKILWNGPKSPIIGYLPEVLPLYNDMKVEEYLIFAYRIKTLGMVQKNNIDNVIEKCSLGNLKRKWIGILSKGQRQKVALAQSLLGAPEMIILDEPLTGLDPESILETRNLIKCLAKEHTIVLSTHQLHEAEKTCDYLTIINKGKIVKSASLEEVLLINKTQNHFEALVKNWGDDKEKIFLDFLNSNQKNVEMTAKRVRDHYSLSWNSEQSEDCRHEFTKKMVEMDCGLLEFIQKNAQLEDVFHDVTKGSE